jgi:hypothetical protein
VKTWATILFTSFAGVPYGSVVPSAGVTFIIEDQEDPCQGATGCGAVW